MSFFRSSPTIVRRDNGKYELQFDDLDAISYDKIGQWINEIDEKIAHLEADRQGKIDSAYARETLKQRKKRVAKEGEWEFIRRHPVRPNINDLNCLNHLIADCAAEKNITAVKGIYRLKGTTIAICDLCKKNNWDADDIKLEIENCWNDTKSRPNSDEEADDIAEIDLSDESDSDDSDDSDKEDPYGSESEPDTDSDRNLSDIEDEEEDS